MKKLLILLLLLGSQVLVARGSVEYTGGTPQLGISNTAPDLLTNWTWAAWVYPTNAAANVVVGRWTNSGSGRQFQLDLNAIRKIRVSVPYLVWGVLTGGTLLDLNKWQHIAATRSGNTWTVYLNGVSDGTVSNATAQESAGTFVLLNNASAFAIFIGRAAEVAGWDAVLTVGEISALAHGTPPNRVRASKIKYYWPFHTRNTGLTHYWPDLGGGGWTATASDLNSLISDHAPMSPPGGAN